MRTSMNDPTSANDENAPRICPKTGRQVERRRERRWASWALPFMGLVSLLWFLIRVLPKPSRATYPCQRAAFPLASGFVVWLTAVVVSSLAYCKAKRLAVRGRYLAAGLFAAVAVALAAICWWPTITGARAAFVPSDSPNSPVGVGTVYERGKEKRTIGGREYLLEYPIRANYGFIRAYKADKMGNLVYWGTARCFNPIIAKACDITIAEVDEIVEVGELASEQIITPGIYIDRIVSIPEDGLK